MYRLMKSEKFTLDHMASRSMGAYRQTLINQFQQFSDAETACDVANIKAGAHHYILNKSGQEYYAGLWIE